MNTHRFITSLFLLVLTFFAGVLHAEEEEATPKATRDEIKEAQAWIKQQLNLSKKSTAILKRVKDNRSAEKSLAAFKKVLPALPGTSTGFGTTGKPKAPEGAGIDQIREKSAKAIEKASTDLTTQIERVEALEIDNPEFAKRIDQLKELEF